MTLLHQMQSCTFTDDLSQKSVNNKINTCNRQLRNVTYLWAAQELVPGFARISVHSQAAGYQHWPQAPDPARQLCSLPTLSPQQLNLQQTDTTTAI